MCWQSISGFTRDLRSPGEMRGIASTTLLDLLASRPERDAVVEDATLIVSELVTNSINAGCTAGTVTLSWHRDQLELAVWDDAPGRPALRSSGPNESHGRGLAITASLSAAWGVELTDPGKRVWAEVAVPPTLTETLNCDR